MYVVIHLIEHKLFCEYHVSDLHVWIHCVTVQWSCVILISINYCLGNEPQTFIKHVEPVGGKPCKGPLYVSWIQRLCLLQWINSIS